MQNVIKCFACGKEKEGYGSKSSATLSAIEASAMLSPKKVEGLSYLSKADKEKAKENRVIAHQMAERMIHSKLGLIRNKWTLQNYIRDKKGDFARDVNFLIYYHEGYKGDVI